MHRYGIASGSEARLTGLFSKRQLLGMGAATLLLIALAIVAVVWLRGQMNRPIWTSDSGPVEVVVGRDVFSIPANMIRFAGQRRNGNAQRVDVALLWPHGDGYSPAKREAFLNAGADRKVVFAHIEPRTMPHDMSARLEPLYSTLVSGEPRSGPGGLMLQSLETGRGYEDEELALAQTGTGGAVWVARCQLADGKTVPICLRDIHIASGTSLTYRFPRAMLADWQAIEKMVLDKVGEW